MLGDTAQAVDLIKDGTDNSFMADVVEESRKQPVLVDFWASWCGPCRTLTPTLEKLVREARGAVKLVKIDVDKNPGVAGQMRVQSLPTVYAFKGGQPVDGFMGALPESEIKRFLQRLLGDAPASEIDQVLALAAESVEVGDLGGAAQAYATALQLDPQNVKALAGMAKIYLAAGEIDQARQFVEAAPADSKDPDLLAARAALELAAEVPADLKAHLDRLSADPDDHEARFEVAKGLAALGRMEEAADHLLRIIEADLDWNEQAARKQLLKIFEAAGPTSEVAKTGRRRLSALLFS